MHHSYTLSQLFDLHHYCTEPSRGEGEPRRNLYQTVRWHPTRLYGAATLMNDLEKVVESRSFFIIWDKTPALLLPCI